ncbi:MAG: aldose 1-epimerase family protein [Bacilli bacterium]
MEQFVWIRNEDVEVAVNPKGAELSNFKDVASGAEYMWQGDANFWAGRAPILFPIVGRVHDNTYTYEGKTYSLTNHGFARHSTFTVFEQGTDFVTMQLVSSDETRAVYPFEFDLRITFKLDGRALSVTHDVKNTGATPLVFTIGGHPAFNCPLEEGLTFSDYTVSFTKEESVGFLPITANGYIAPESEPAKVKDIPLNAHTFDNDALIYEGYETAEMSIHSSKGTRGVKVAFDGFPYVGIWSKPNCAPFVCIEPWMGHSNVEGFSGAFEEKVGMITLPANDTWQGVYTISIF